MDKEEFAAELKAGMQEQELSASDLARTLALHPSTVHNWLKGKSLPTGPKKWAELTRTLGRELRPAPLIDPAGPPPPLQTLALLRQALATQQRSVAQLQQVILALETVDHT